MKTTTLFTYQERMRLVLVRIQENLDQDLSLEDLAGEAFFSPSHFHRIFKGMFGETLMEHIRRLRLERAAGLLRYTRKPVTDLAFGAGYETLESFSRAFRTMTGLSPSAYRRVHGAGAVPPRNRRAGSDALPPGPGHPFSTPIQGASSMNVTIVTLPPMKGVSLRHTGPYMDCGQAWERLCAWAGQRGLLTPESILLGISHDDPSITPPDKIRYDAVILTDREVRPEGEVGRCEIPGGEYAVVRHVGPYQGLEAAYAQIMGRWLPTSGREMDMNAPGFEIYRNTPDRTPPEELVTDIHIRLLPA